MDWNKFWRLYLQGFLNNLRSVKVWIFLLPFIASTTFLGLSLKNTVDTTKDGLIKHGANKQVVEFIQNQEDAKKNMLQIWLTFNSTLAGIVIGAREAFKVAKLSKVDDEEAKEMNI